MKILLLLTVVACAHAKSPEVISNHQTQTPVEHPKYTGTWGGWEYWKAVCKPRDFICGLWGGCRCVP